MESASAGGVFPRLGKRMDLGFLFVAVVVVLVNCAIGIDTLSLDTKSLVVNFFTYYNELVQHNAVQLWDPYHLFGISTDVRVFSLMSCPLYLAAVVGKLLGVQDATVPFRVGVALEQLFFVAGVGLWARRRIGRRAGFVLLLSMALTTVWHIQIWFNFRIYSLLPFVLFFLEDGILEARPARLWLAGSVFFLSMLGAPLYALPVLTFLALVYGAAFALASRGALGRLGRLRLWLTPGALAALLVFVGLAWALADLSRGMLEAMSIAGSGGRDPFTGKVSLRTFLFALAGPEKSVSSFWELVYAAPRDWITTMYAGLFSLVFFAYALLARARIALPGLAASLAGLTASAAVGLASLTILAPALYAVFPVMDRTRYLCSYLVLVKFFLLLVAGFGLDAFLRALDAGGEEAGRASRTVARLGLGLCALIAAMDLVFRGFPYQAMLVPYAFHFVALALLAAFCLHTLSARPFGRRAYPLLAGLALAELASYAFLTILAVQPAESQTPGSRFLEKPYLTVRESRASDKSMRALFAVRPYAYQPERLPYRDLRAYDYQAWTWAEHYKFDYLDALSALPVDVCEAVVAPQQLPLGLVRFEQAKRGLDLDEPLQDTPLWFANNIMDPGRYFGCASPKAFLTSEVFETSSLAEAAEYLHEFPQADRRPTVVPASLALAAGRAEDKAIRPTVELCAAGRCFPGRIDDPADWKLARETARGGGIGVAVTYPGPKRLTKYRLRAPDSPQAASMPQSWQLLALGPDQTWKVVDAQSGQTGWRSGEHRDFALPQPLEYKRYFLNIDAGNVPDELLLGRFDLLRYEDGAAVADERRPADVASFAANAVAMTADVPPGRDQWLVYLDNFDPGWRAVVDGVPAPLYAANLAFKAVKLPPGRHEVRFDYVGRGRNGTLMAGCLVVGCVFSLWLLGVLLAQLFPLLPLPWPIGRLPAQEP